MELSEEGKKSVMQKLEFIKQVSTLLTIEEVNSSKQVREHRIHAKTSEPVANRYATARRFSIARARSREPHVA